MSTSSPAETSNLVRAAGGAVWRRRGETLEVVLVHRPAYDDWSLPKGKVDGAETDEDAALREVAEETCLEAILGVELPKTSYVDRKGRPKVVRYWAMTIFEGEPTGANEVDDARWVNLEHARRLITYERDIPVLEALQQLV